jgi:hypothetical protein
MYNTWGENRPIIFRLENHRGRDQFESLSVDGKIILKLFLMKLS